MVEVSFLGEYIMLNADLIQNHMVSTLKEFALQMDVTSIWLCRFDFVNNQSTIIGEYAKFEANIMERTSELGAVYPEFSATWRDWLRTGNGYQTEHIDEMDRNDPDWVEYVEGGVDSVAYYPVKISGIVWGYVELWESRGKRTFDTPQEVAMMKQFSQQIGILLTAIFSDLAA